jgi:hypothetical protein
MSYLKLHRDEPEHEPPAPIPFQRPDRTWRGTDADQSIDSIRQVENALSDVESKFDRLREQAKELTEPIRMADWMDEDDDGPYAA